MIIYIDMDDVLCDYSTAFRAAVEQSPSIQFPQSQYGFFERLVPISGAVSTLQAIISSTNHDPYILTAPSTRNPWSYVEKRVWVERHLGYEWVERLIICSNKGLLRGDLLIDDNVAGKGQEHFEGRIIHFGSAMFPDWQSVRKHLGLGSTSLDS